MKRIFDFMTAAAIVLAAAGCAKEIEGEIQVPEQQEYEAGTMVDRKSTRLNSSHTS